MILDFYQIVYRDEQEKECYPFAKIYRNERLTPYFENSVICDLLRSRDNDQGVKETVSYVGVCSWALKRKRQDGATPQVLKNSLDLTEEKILKHDFDVAILCPFDPLFEVMENSAVWHDYAGGQFTGNWTKALTKFREFMPIPEKITGNAIFGNHFIARRELYQQYVRECLAPAIQFMEENEVFRLPSGYREKKERLTRGTDIVPETLRKLSEYRGYPVEDWEIGVFILERLFRWWIDGKALHIINV